MLTVPINTIVPFTSSTGLGDVSMIWLGVQPVTLATDVCGGKFANWVMIAGESVPVGVEIKSNVGVVRKTSDGSPGIIKVAIKNSTQNKAVINIEIAADCPNRRDENSRSIL